MANMRVHELAKELNITSKDITDMLSNSEKTYKPVSGLTDSEITSVRKKFAPAPKAENKPAAQPAKQSQPVKNDNRDNRQQNQASKQSQQGTQNKSGNADDKKHISQVYFPQNSSRDKNSRRDNNNRDGQRDNNGGYRNNDRNNGGYRNNDRDNNGGYRNNDRGNNGYRNNDRNNNGGYGNRDNNGGYRNNDRNNNGGYGNRDNNGYRNNDRNNGGYRNNDRNNNGGYGNRDNNGGYRNNDRNNNGGYGNRDNNGGYRNNDRNNNGGFRNDRNGQSGNGGFRKDNDQNRGGFNGGQRRNNDRRDSAPKEEFDFSAKPDSRRHDSRIDSKKNDRKRDNEAKENLKFANSRFDKKPMTKPEKKEKEEETIKQLVLPDTLTIKELADKMKVAPAALVKKLFLQGKVVTINEEIDYDAAEEIALEFNCICEHEEKVDVIAELLKEDEEPEDKLVPRPPVVCVMGHVDHGKTSLLDAIRETHVTAKESGGITQKIGAYQVNVNGNLITFLDTPGHEAFTAMRMRGAQATDIAILVVAADDGVMPQTIEAINHAKAAGVEIIVAVNKIDKPNANIEKVKQELTEYGLIAEDWGGSTTFVPVSAHTKQGIDELLDMILLTAEVNELKANPDRKARGIVIEAELDKGRGPVASILVQKGTLHVGDAVSAGSCYGKIRAMIDDKGNRVKVAGPSTPVEILGLNDVPNAGEIIMAADSEKEARSTAETFISEGRKKLLDDTKHKVSLDALFEQIQAGNMKELNIIIKADVQGSVEAVKSSLVRLSNDEVVVKVIHGGVGNVNESDVVLASASNAIIIAFNVKPDNQARIVAEREKVDLRLYSVIYNAIEDVEAALKGMLEPIYEEKIIGHARIMQIFKASGVGNIAGCIVEEGRITRDSVVRITRGSEKVYEGPIASLKHFKDEVKEIKAGTECGMVFEKFNDIQPEDMIEAHIMVEVPR